VIRTYAVGEAWPHRWVTLFVLQDLQPLVRQLEAGGARTAEAGMGLASRPVVNMYDLAHLAGCSVFVNREVAEGEGYWGDDLAMRGLLAHEHAHPLSENEAVRASRELKVDLSLESSASADRLGWDEDRQSRVCDLLARQARRLGVGAPREVFANELAIRSGFRAAMAHVNRRNVINARRSVDGRAYLRRMVDREMDQGRLGSRAADLLMLIGDLEGHLDLAMEIAAFYRAGRADDARELEGILEGDVLPRLSPGVARAYGALRDQYLALEPTMGRGEMHRWTREVLGVLTEVVAEGALTLRWDLRVADEGEGSEARLPELE
jgi:ribosomal protein L34